MSRVFLYIWSFLTLCILCSAETRVYNFTASYINRNPDGVHERRVIALNGEWPLPVIRVKEYDRVIINLTNQLEEGKSTSLHFHGLFQQDSNWMDGPEMVTQCPIPYGHTFVYNFTITAQSGTYWYHSHSGSQYSDGLRGVFIVEPKHEPDYFDFDEEVTLSVSDWYHQESADLMKTFLNKYNPTGAEPIPQNSLFNDTKNVTWEVQPDTSYLLRIVNMGMFVSQYVYIEGHNFTVVEIDGVDVEPYECDSILISVAQRYTVIVKTKSVSELGSFRFVNIIEKDMLDFHPPDLQIISTNWMKYTGSKQQLPLPLLQKSYDSVIGELSPLDDMELIPVLKEPILGQPDYQILLNFTMETLGDGVQYAMFNGLSYTPPKVPTLYSVLSSNDSDIASNPAIYGSNTNTFVLQEDEIVEIVLNNQDPGNHPFHLHGHIFQVLERLEQGEDEENPITYDPESERDYPEIPMQRDTIVVKANGFVVIRFKASNAGVWFFHCHVDWHLEQGLAITLVEAPTKIKELYQNKIPKSHFEACKIDNIPISGNAAGNTQNWFDLAGENVQFKPLPEGFTSKGYVALLVSALFGIYGIFSIYRYGMEDVKSDNSEFVIKRLYDILEKYDNESALNTLNSEREIE